MKREQEREGVKKEGDSHPASHRVRVKVTEERKGKSPGVKGKWDDLR